MQHDLNRAEFSGRLVKDVEIRTIGEGEKKFSAASFTLAVGRKPKKDDKGNWVNETDFVNFVCTGSEAENGGSLRPLDEPRWMYLRSVFCRCSNPDNVYVYLSRVICVLIREYVQFMLNDG